MSQTSAASAPASNSDCATASHATTHSQAEEDELATASEKLNALIAASRERRARLAKRLKDIELPTLEEMNKVIELSRTVSAELDSTEVMVARHNAWMSSISDSTATELYDDALSPSSSNVSSQSSVDSHSPNVAYEPPTQRRRLDDGSAFF
jgi:uncharacterized protein YfaS (alpha-2-macroglobulin family)